MRVNFKHPKTSTSVKKQKRLQKELDKRATDAAMEAHDESTSGWLKNPDLSKAKRKQIFKKHKAKDIKAQIAQLKLESKKMKKKNLD